MGDRGAGDGLVEELAEWLPAVGGTPNEETLGGDELLDVLVVVEVELLVDLVGVLAFAHGSMELVTHGENEACEFEVQHWDFEHKGNPAFVLTERGVEAD